jgi:hypothetical protein
MKTLASGVGLALALHGLAMTARAQDPQSSEVVWVTQLSGISG